MEKALYAHMPRGSKKRVKRKKLNLYREVRIDCEKVEMWNMLKPEKLWKLKRWMLDLLEE